ncbi:MAG: SEC-C domain-containing protein [Candidatus Cloacimonetes bacterium]|nr:SEC-C domain-containing protein [Candidatus Cloacimonadota bacterium]MCF7815099.1 SEC-C domain-containing protein [Candidatus Cloacimonadota bacterium]MCF7869323.1 SEC-C domain-containing protein [Candidatus Cloacimonadota bacterium]MCF7884725.1 SEC-C domain-containing protein [Candidatus Cloacimonadota bacterium]
MAKIGRNDPCPCGSGKKYKHWCWNKKQKNLSEDYIRNLFQQIDEKIFDEILRFSLFTFGKAVVDFAWQDFTNFTEENFNEEDNPHDQLFFPWFLYSWLPQDFFPDLKNLKNQTIAELYLTKNIMNLTSNERDYIRCVKSNPFSFYQIMDIKYDHYVIINDIFTGDTFKVLDYLLSRSVQINTFIYCRVIHIQNVNFILGCSSINIPPEYKIQLLSLKKEILESEKKITKSILFDWSDEIREEYFALYNSLTRPPKLVNKNGDPLSFNDIIYEISDPHKIWESLKHLSSPLTKEEFLERAEFDAEGNLYKIEFSWLSPQKGNDIISSIYAYIQIEGNELVVSVNSDKRAKYARKKMKSLLGNNAKYKLTKTKPYENAKREFSQQPEIEPDPKMKEFEESPEFKELIDNFLENHWKNWINEKIPALGNITPKQALHNEIDKEKLITLLDKFERDDNKLDPKMKQIKYIKWVRKELGL